MTTRGTGPADDPEPSVPPSSGRGSRALGNRAVLVSSASTVLFFAIIAVVVALAPGSGVVAERFFSPFHLWRSLVGSESEPSVMGAFLLNVEIFVPDREPHETMALVAQLRSIGIRGRHAAYLASVAPPREPGTPEMTMYLKEFDLMVDSAARPAAAEIIGIPPALS